MPFFQTSTEWQKQSALLLQARPTTTRITSKYTVLKPTASKIEKRKAYLEKRAAKTSKTTRSSSPPAEPRNPEDPTATFVLKTYDPQSGTCLQYETTKAAEVGRLISGLGRLGRHMAALPELAEDMDVLGDGAGVSTPKVEQEAQLGGAPAAAASAGGAGGAGGGGGGKKKKKSKK